MVTEHTNDSPVTAPLTPAMTAALTDAAARWDSAVLANRGTWTALYRRGLVTIVTGRGTDRRGETTYNVVVGIKINDAGRAAVAA